VTGGDDELDPFLRELSEAGVSEAEAMDALVDALEPAPLPAALRARILASTRTESRFASFADQVAKLVDVAVDTAKELLLGIDREESWGPAAVPAMQLYNFDGGPAVTNAITGFVRMPVGSAFPHHAHIGQETVLVLQGRLKESNGDIVGPGDVKVGAAGTEHAFEVMEGPELIYLVVVQKGITIGEETFGPDDPRM
jgi:hypothetical protein